MNRRTALLSAALLAVLAGLCALPRTAGDRTDAPENGSSETVFVSIAPLRGLVEALLPSGFAVREIVPPGASPEQFEPSPADVRALTRATALFAIGENFESAWLDRVRAQLPGLRVVDLGEGLATLRFEDGDAEEEDGDGHPEHVHSGADPHVWTDPLILAELARRAAAELGALHPSRKAEIDSLLALSEVRYAELDSELAARFAPFRGRAVLVFHPAWGYLCHRYGLRQIAVEESGRSPSPRTLAKTVRLAREEKIAAIFVSAQTDRRVAEAISQELGIPVAVVDPLHPDPAESLRKASEAIGRALSAEAAE